MRSLSGGRLIVTVTTGEIVGKVKDVLIDPETWEVAALVLPGKMFSHDPVGQQATPWKNISLNKIN